VKLDAILQIQKMISFLVLKGLWHWGNARPKMLFVMGNTNTNFA